MNDKEVPTYDLIQIPNPHCPNPQISISCDKEGADISIQLHDQHTEDMVKEINSLVEVSTKEIAKNITGAILYFLGHLPCC